MRQRIGMCHRIGFWDLATERMDVLVNEFVDVFLFDIGLFPSALQACRDLVVHPTPTNTL